LASIGHIDLLVLHDDVLPPLGVDRQNSVGVTAAESVQRKRLDVGGES
jgi:hypothetical protein